MRRIITVAFIALSLMSCNMEDSLLPSKDKISFRARPSSILTKTEYTDVVENVARIDWRKGDNISIFCPEALEEKQADYAVTSVLESKNGKTSEAVITCLNEEDALSWGSYEEEHHIYSVFPSPATSLCEEDVFADAKVTGFIFEEQTPLSCDKTRAGEYLARPDMRSQYMVARTSIVPSKKESTVFLEFCPLTTAIEFEIQNDYSISDSMKVASIQLISESHALNGAFSVDLTKWNTANGLPETTSENLSEGSKKVVCDFSNVGHGYVALGHGEKLTFTLFLLPNEDIDDLVFMVVDPEGGYVSTKLAYSNDPEHGNDGVNFPHSKKSFVKGILVPEGARWTVTYLADLASWANQDAGNIAFSNPELQTVNLVSSWLSGEADYVQMDGDYTYSLTVSSDPALLAATDKGDVIADAINVDSKKTNDIIGVKAANWRLQIYDETNDKWVDASADRTKNPKGTQWVSFNRIAGSGDANIEVKVWPGNLSNSDEVVSESSTIADHDKILRETPARGSESSPWDLSAYDIYGNPNTNGAETANCYVISAPGWYAFPLVYGNAITKGRDNKTSYNPQYSNTSQRYLRQFQSTHGSGVGFSLIDLQGIASFHSDFSGGQISSPYIETDVSQYEDRNNRAGCKVGGTPETYRYFFTDYVGTNNWTAFPIWQDTENPIVSDNSSSCYVISASEASGRGLALGGQCGYVVFHVNDNLTQSNVLIGVNHEYRRYHGLGPISTSWNRLMWSWHIWVTDEPLTTINIDNGEGQKSAMMPVNLGWVDGGQTIHTSYRDLDAKVRIAQERNDGEEYYSDGINIKRAGHQLSTISPDGSCPYYQWGRPTPMPRLKNPGLTNISNVANSGYTLHGGYSIGVTPVANTSGNQSELLCTTIGVALRNPATFYGTPVSTQGVLVTVEVYGQWFCEPYGSVATLAASTGYTPANLWNAACYSGGTSSLPTVKTVYDPCPPGFCVPNGDSFNGIQRADDGSTFSTHKGINFYTSPERHETIFLPAMGGINRGGLLMDLSESVSQGELVTSGHMDYVGTKGFYWLSTGGASALPGATLVSGNDSHSLRIENGSINGNTEQNRRANGFCVRPQKIVEWDKF